MASNAEILERELPGLQHDVPVAPHCAYRVGGPAEHLYAATRTEDLRHAVVVARALGVPVTVLGQATNVLVSDRGVAGLVVLARNDSVRLDDEVVTAGAGALLPEVVNDLAQRGLAGLEFAGNIPGSVGGAVVGNAGAYGRAVGDALVRARILAGEQEYAAGPGDLGLGYRTTALKRNPGAVVLEATFALTGGSRNALLDEIARDAELRRRKHPLDYASCGSYFKNPSRDTPAAKLIDELGLKGFRMGRAQVSRQHANFIVALPGAGALDIRRVADEVRRRVFERFGVRLEEEVVLLGFE
ncbi:MAG TPA: UDP-N-acetylmuramate dehydrogenase [Thermoleophilia bacterium]|nr:UDP-N-acetylmuramate dehydrogenase [Thermoleophilia bacterium]